MTLMTKKAEIPQQRARVKMKKAGKAQEMLAARWRPEKALTRGSTETMWMQAPQKLRRRTPELEQLPREQKPVWLRLENPRMLMQARRVVEQPELPGRLRPSLAQTTKNSAHPRRSLRAWVELGTAARRMQQAFPGGETSLPA